MKNLIAFIILSVFFTDVFAQKVEAKFEREIPSVKGSALFGKLISNANSNILSNAKLSSIYSPLTDRTPTVFTLLQQNNDLLRNTRPAGFGMNDYEGNWCGKCIENSTFESSGNSQLKSFELIRIENYETLRKALEVDTKVSLGFSVFSADFSSYLYKSFSLNSYKLYLMVKVSVRNSPEYLSSVNFNINGLENLRKGNSAIERHANFFAAMWFKIHLRPYYWRSIIWNY